ncbi:MAG: transcriptional regulator, BadM/Rrf2 family [Chloroflexi bacterium]|nr:transcriptional regulator, BadM/Rrf2 family [Chloroflexota bacterium]
MAGSGPRGRHGPPPRSAVGPQVGHRPAAALPAVDSGSPALGVRRLHSSGAISFSTKGEYGVRLLVQLARRHGRGPVSLAEVAADEELPRAYLEQLVIPLRDAGLVTSTRGARGGYTLARPPDEITMAEALRALEGPLAPMICASEDPAEALACLRAGSCSVHVLWARVRDAIGDVLVSVSLADLVPIPTAVPARSAGSAGQLESTPARGDAATI